MSVLLQAYVPVDHTIVSAHRHKLFGAWRRRIRVTLVAGRFVHKVVRNRDTLVSFSGALVAAEESKVDVRRPLHT